MSDINKKTRASRAGFVMSPEEKMKESRKGLSSYEQLQFPSDLAAYGFIMNFQEFSFNAGQADGNTDLGPTRIQTNDSIILPIPSPLNQNYSVAIEDTKTGPFVQAFAKTLAAYTSGNENDPNASEIFGDLFGSGEDADADVGGAVRAAPGTAKAVKQAYSLLTGSKLGRSAGKAVLGDSAFSAVEQALGSIYNPSNIAAFKGTPLRKHSLNWKLSPRNAKETLALNTIVSKIRKRMHSSLEGIGSDGLFVQTYPDILQCALITPDVNQNIFYKPGLISNFLVDHSGNEQTNFFAETGSPVQYDIKLEFMEIDYITREDFGDDIDGGIN
jgi:hypothetical protein